MKNIHQCIKLMCTLKCTCNVHLTKFFHQHTCVKIVHSCWKCVTNHQYYQLYKLSKYNEREHVHVCVCACMWVCNLLKGELSPRWNHYIFTSTYRGNTSSKLHWSAANITGFMQGNWTTYILNVNHLCHYAIKLKLESHLYHPPQILGTRRLFILHWERHTEAMSTAVSAFQSVQTLNKLVAQISCWEQKMGP